MSYYIYLSTNNPGHSLITFSNVKLMKLNPSGDIYKSLLF